jgi:hypothetical protein
MAYVAGFLFLFLKKRGTIMMERILCYHCRMDEEVPFYSFSL